MPNIGDIGGKIGRLCFINRKDGYFIAEWSQPKYAWYA
jgi:hypothetical protein